MLKNAQQFYIQSSDGKFAIFDATKNVAYMKEISSTGASTFTAFQKDCNTDEFCSGNVCMLDSGGFLTLNYYSNNQPSRWTLTSPGGDVAGPYYVRNSRFQYLTYKNTRGGHDVLSRSLYKDKNSISLKLVEF